MVTKVDSRLLGTWQSDARRTRRELRARRDIFPKRARALGALFGQLRIRFIRSRCHLTLHGETEKRPYTVVAKDSSSAVIVSGDVLTQIHFVDSHFWIIVGAGIFREFFKRIDAPKWRAVS